MFWLLLLPICLFASWSAPITIESSAQEMTSPEIVINSSGTALVCWQSDEEESIQASFYSPTLSSWSTPLILGTSGLQARTQKPAIVDGSGVGLVAWLITDGTTKIVSSYYTPATESWSSQTLVSVDGDTSSGLTLSSSGPGNAFAAWDITALGNNVIKSNIFNFTTLTWEGIETVTDNAETADLAQVSANTSNRAGLVYKNVVTPGNSQTKASIYSGSSWSSADLVSNASRNSTDPFIANNTSNTQVAVWESVSGADQYIAAALYNPTAGTWSTPQDLSVAGTLVFSQVPILENNGNAHAFWLLNDGSNTILQTARYTASSATWSSPTNLTTGDTGFGEENVFSSALLTNGDVMTVWWSTDGGENDILYSLYSSSAGTWSSPERLSTEGVLSVTPEVAAGPNGSAIATWVAIDGSDYRIESAIFTSLPLNALNFSGSQKANRFGGQTAYRNVLSWSASPTTDVTRYYLYRNGVLIADLPATTVGYVDKFRFKGVAVNYTLKAVNASGESSGTTIRVL
ncbi:MAG: hypothetical protein MRY21_05615 [Simkaniaceae bacterium]|nr:hypothetical protein [Simkaniaceae bacterium]